MNPNSEHKHLPLRQQARITYDRYPILVWAITALFAIVTILAVAAAIAINNTNRNTGRIDRQSNRSEKAICAIKDFSDKLVAANPRRTSELNNLSLKMGKLVHCLDGRPAKTQPPTSP